MPACYQLLTQFAEVVDLAVVDDDYTFVFVEQRLCAALEINDGEPAMAEPTARFMEIAITVGPTMNQGLGHRGKTPEIDGACVAQIEDARDTAHFNWSKCRTGLGRGNILRCGLS